MSYLLRRNNSGQICKQSKWYAKTQVIMNKVNSCNKLLVPSLINSLKVKECDMYIYIYITIIYL
jgi:hypothetical protein